MLSTIIDIKAEFKVKNLLSWSSHPIRVVQQGNNHVIVVIESSGVQRPMLFIPYRISGYPLSWNLPCESV